MAAEFVVGIDFGTKNTSVTVLKNDDIVLQCNSVDHPELKPCVSFGEGSRIFGRKAEEKLLTNPKNTVFAVKRLLGLNWEEAVKEKQKLCLPYDIQKSEELNEHRPIIKVKHNGRELNFFPEDIAAMFLKNIKNYVENEIKHAVFKAFIAVPGNFNSYQRQAVIDSAKIAGFTDVNLVNESTALVFAAKSENNPRDRLHLVTIDIGGGYVTVSSSVLVGKSRVEVKYVKVGDEGDLNCDADLVKECEKFVESKFPKVNSENIQEKLRDYIIRCKVDHLNGKYHFKVLLNDSYFDKEKIDLSDIIDTYLIMLKTIVHDAVLQIKRYVTIDRIVFHGRFCGIPMIKESLIEEFPFVEIIDYVDQISFGAAVYFLDNFKKIIFSEKSHTYFEVRRDDKTVLSSSKYQVGKSYYHTLSSGIYYIHERRENQSNNSSIGSIVLIPKRPVLAALPISVQLHVTMDGFFKVEAKQYLKSSHELDCSWFFERNLQTSIEKERHLSAEDIRLMCAQDATTKSSHKVCDTSLNSHSNLRNDAPNNSFKSIFTHQSREMTELKALLNSIKNNHSLPFIDVVTKMRLDSVEEWMKENDAAPISEFKKVNGSLHELISLINEEISPQTQPNIHNKDERNSNITDSEALKTISPYNSKNYNSHTSDATQIISEEQHHQFSQPQHVMTVTDEQTDSIEDLTCALKDLSMEEKKGMRIGNTDTLSEKKCSFETNKLDNSAHSCFKTDQLSSVELASSDLPSVKQKTYNGSSSTLLPENISMNGNTITRSDESPLKKEILLPDDGELKYSKNINPLNSDIERSIMNIASQSELNLSRNAVKSKKVILGIDIGSSKCCIALAHKDEIFVIENESGQKTTPSCIAFTETKRLFGWEAQSKSTCKNSCTVQNAKICLGNNFNKKVVQCSVDSNMIKSKEGKIIYSLNGDTVKLVPEQIVAMLLKHFSLYVEENYNCEAKEVILTVPNYFNSDQRRALLNAAQVAGLTVLNFLNETTATAVALRESKGHIFGEVTALIFDMGSVGMSASVVKMSNNSLEVIAIGGKPGKAGDYFDLKLKEHFEAEIESKYGYDLGNDGNASKKLKAKCEEVKKKLSLPKLNRTEITIDNLFKNKDFKSSIERSNFEDLIRSDLKTTVHGLLRETLKKSKKQCDEIEEIILVGGSTRIPLVKSVFQEFFKNSTFKSTINANECTALGAAFYSCISGDVVTDQLSFDSFQFSTNYRDDIMLHMDGNDYHIDKYGILSPTANSSSAVCPEIKKWSDEIERFEKADEESDQMDVAFTDFEKMCNKMRDLFKKPKGAFKTELDDTQRSNIVKYCNEIKEWVYEEPNLKIKKIMKKREEIRNQVLALCREG